MKKTLAIILALCLGASMLAACGGSGSSAPASASVAGSTGSSAPEAKPVEIRVVTSYGGDDGNRANYEEAVAGYEAATGNTVVDESATSNEQWKAQVKADFQTGSEPDVLFFFTGTDASEFIKNGKVVSIEEIRKEYPDYASNMLDAAMPLSFVDAKAYAVPSSGYWEGMFVNKTVLADCGLEVPGPDTTWDEFMEMCETIKSKGYTPIACSLQEVPHYWFEFCILNQGDVAKHAEVPASGADEAGQRPGAHPVYHPAAAAQHAVYLPGAGHYRLAEGVRPAVDHVCGRPAAGQILADRHIYVLPDYGAAGRGLRLGHRHPHRGAGCCDQPDREPHLQRKRLLRGAFL